MNRTLIVVAAILVLALPCVAVAESELTLTPPTPGGFVPSVAQTVGNTEAETYYVDRATFQTANPGLALEDFETPLWPPGSAALEGCPEPADANGSAGCYDPGELLAGFSMTSPGAGTPGAELVLIEGAAGFGTPSGVVLGSNTFTAITRIDFDPPVAAIGFDIITVLTGNPVTINLYDAAGTPFASQTSVPGGAAGSFWGVDSDTPIAAIEISDDTGADVELLDDMEFGDPIPVELQSITIE